MPRAACPPDIPSKFWNTAVLLLDIWNWCRRCLQAPPLPPAPSSRPVAARYEIVRVYVCLYSVYVGMCGAHGSGRRLIAYPYAMHPTTHNSQVDITRLMIECTYDTSQSKRLFSFVYLYVTQIRDTGDTLGSGANPAAGDTHTMHAHPVSVTALRLSLSPLRLTGDTRDGHGGGSRFAFGRDHACI